MPSVCGNGRHRNTDISGSEEKQGSENGYNDVFIGSVLTKCDESCVTSLLLLQEVSEAWFSMSHSVPLLRKVGLPVQAGIRVNSANRGNGSYSYMLNCSAGSQQVGDRGRQTSLPERLWFIF